MKEESAMNRRISPLSGILALAASALLLVAAPLAAQKTSSSIHGTVTGDSGPVAGAQVVAVNSDSGFTRDAKSGADGGYTLLGLTPGSYEVIVTADNFLEQRVTLQVLLGQSPQVDFKMPLATVQGEQIEVVGVAAQTQIDTHSSTIETNITPQQIESLPQNNRNFLNFAALAPGVRFTTNQDEQGQKVHSGGEDARQINVYIDGLSYKNDLLQGGAFMQDSSRGNPFPQNAVQEFRVLTQNYKAEYEQAAAAVITAVTRSGGNTFKGDAFYYSQNKSMVTQDEFSEARGEEKPDYKRQQGGLDFGGPITKDKLHFFVSYEQNKQDRAASVFRGGSFGAAPADVQALLGQYSTGTLLQPFDEKLYFGKLSWQPSPSQSADFSYHKRDESEVRGFGGQRVRQGAENFLDKTDALVIQHQAVFGGSLNEGSVTYQKLHWNPSGVDTSVPHENYIGILDVGGKDSTQDFQQKKLGVRDDFTKLFDWRGSHSVKVGTAISRLDYDVSKTQFDNPLFEFRDLEQWEFPFHARLGAGNPGLSFNNTQFGIYAQDDWQVLANLTINLGVRWDYETNMVNNDYVTPPALVDALQNACTTFSQPIGGQSSWCIPEILDLQRYTTDGNRRDPYTGMIQPRLGFAWDVASDGKTVVFGGWGRYYDRVILNDIFDESYRQTHPQYEFCFSADGSPSPNCSVPAIPWDPSYLSRQGLLDLIASGRAGSPEVYLVANDLKPPRSNQWTLGVRRQLGAWKSSLSYGNVRGFNGLSYFFGDRVPGTSFNDRFGNNIPIPGYGRVFITSSARQTWSSSYMFTLDKPYTVESRWGFDLAYTYTDAFQEGTDNPSEGVAFGAFDYLSSATFYKIPASNEEKHRLVMTGTVGLPANFRVSSVITLGSGLPYTIFDDSHDPFTVRWNEGTPPKSSFIIPNAWGYRSVDLRLEWDAPPISNTVKIGLVAEGFNVFNYSNYNGFDNFRPRLPAVNPTFGNPTSAFNARRFQVGARVSF
jgi:outer membrane receptor protein involved in Fe transport